MIGKAKKWQLQSYKQEEALTLAHKLGISPLVTGILLERGMSTTEKIKEFLHGSETPFHDPYLLKDMDRTVLRIERALAHGEKITVYGDYDVDGITASSLLYIYLNRCGAKVSTYIPKRDNEGYGLNDEALKTIHESGTTLIITVDCGISGVHEVANAPQGMDIIITDHHTVPPILPQAYAIINPKQEDCHYPFKVLSGVGVAFKLCQALEQRRTGKHVYWDDLTELVALGTVADIVPLQGENRELVRRGLKAMASTRLVGLQALIEGSGCQNDAITSENIGFGLAPRLNASGRLEHAQLAVELFITQDKAKAQAITEELNRENALRQEISKQIQEEAEALLAQEEHIDTAIVLASKGWHQGVIGIVASRLVDKYNLPTILISINEEGMAKGSCRSIPALNLYDAIAAEADILTQFGGHHQAAGLTLPAANLPEFKQRFRTYVQEHLQEEDYLPIQTIDSLLPADTVIKVRDLQELSLLEPFGCDNPAPVFAFQNAKLRSPRAIGKERTHLQFFIEQQGGGYKGLMWNKANLLPFLYDGMSLDIAFSPRINQWRNEISVQLHGLSLKPHLSLGDYRQQHCRKQDVVKAWARTENKIAVYVNNEQLSEDLQAEKPVKLLKYGEVIDAPVAICYDLPQQSILSIVEQLRYSAKKIVLLYNYDDLTQLQASLALTHPSRTQLTVAYQRLMRRLQQGSVNRAAFLEEEQDFVSNNALLIMEELDFIHLDGDEINLGSIRKRSLEESPLYCKLQGDSEKLMKLAQENLLLTQQEILLGLE